MEFTTIKKEVKVEIIQKKSRFIANLFPIQTVDEAQNIINNIKKKYHDARHNCIAYRVMQDGSIIEKSSDDR